MTADGDSHYLEPWFVTRGWPAVAFHRTLRRHMPELVECLDPALRRPLEDALADLERAAVAYAVARQRGTSVPTAAENGADSEPMDVMSTQEAAEVLGCIPRYVRRLAAEGRLPGRRTRHRWQLDGAAVRAFRDTHEQETR
jgi:excisionase family DNA binding protein